MSVVLTVLIIIVAILLILVVLVQNSKGGGLASNFSTPNQMMGVQKTTDFIEKATWGLAIALLVLCVATSFFSQTPQATIQESRTKGNTEQNINPATTPELEVGPEDLLEEEDTDQ